MRRVVVSGHSQSQLKAFFSAERSPLGKPSLGDFYQIDLPVVSDQLLSEWDQLPYWYGHPNYKALFIFGRLAYSYYVVAELVEETIVIVDMNLEWHTAK